MVQKMFLSIIFGLKCKTLLILGFEPTTCRFGRFYKKGFTKKLGFWYIFRYKRILKA